jgi:cardiolipin synthase
MREVRSRTNFNILALLLGCTIALAACATVPNVGKAIQASEKSDLPPTLVGSQGPLSQEQTQAILASVKNQAADTDLLDRHLKVEQALAGSPLVAGNRTNILEDGTETFRAMFAAMDRAKSQINLEYYIFEDVESDGRNLGDLLVAKRRAGVAVNVIYDSYGSMSTPSAFFKRLKTAGVQLVEYNPINPLDATNGYSLNDRDHRKMLIVDGSTAIVGGVNLSSAYQSHPFGRFVGSGGKPTDYWRDVDLQIEGPAVAELEKLFIQHWTAQKGPPLDQAGFFPTVPPEGKQVLHIIGSTKDDTIPRYYATLISAITNAGKTVWVTTAYFVPTDEELDSLERAARRGVDVRLLLPGKSDSELALAVGHASYTDLLEAGVRIYETQNEVLHSKTAVIDGVWSVIGSSNFDHRSALFNDEVDAVVLGRETAARLESLFLEQLHDAKEIKLSTWRDRPFGDKLDETFSSLWQDLL